MNQRKYTPLYEKDTQQNENSSMETTWVAEMGGGHFWFGFE